jgi:hypothetical protein
MHVPLHMPASHALFCTALPCIRLPLCFLNSSNYLIQQCCSTRLYCSSSAAVPGCTAAAGAADDPAPWRPCISSSLKSTATARAAATKTVRQYQCVNISVSSIVAHGAEVGSSRAPHFDGANR